LEDDAAAPGPPFPVSQGRSDRIPPWESQYGCGVSGVKKPPDAAAASLSPLRARPCGLHRLYVSAGVYTRPRSGPGRGLARPVARLPGSSHRRPLRPRPPHA